MLTSAQPPRDREFIERGEMIGEVRSPFEAVERTALTWGERDALHIPVTACADYAAQPITYSYAELYEAVLSASAQWSGAAVCGRIALVLENRPEFFIHWLALNALGMVIPLNHDTEAPLLSMAAQSLWFVWKSTCPHVADLRRFVRQHSRVTPDGISSPHWVASLSIKGMTTILNARSCTPQGAQVNPRDAFFLTIILCSKGFGTDAWVATSACSQVVSGY